MEYLERGICRLSIVPVRKKGQDKAEQVTQLLFGDHYSVIGKSKDQKWLKVEVYFDGYIGWIDTKQHHGISDEYFVQVNNSDFKISLDLTTSILYKKKPMHIVLGSILPVTNNELFKVEEQLAFNGESKSLGQKRDQEFIKKIAKMYVGAPYLWGGKSPFGLDCSGFTQMVYKINGYRLKRDASEQILQGKEIDFNSAQLGDLAFFGTFDKITHVGIVLEDNKIIHASGKVRIDVLQEEGIYDDGTQQITHNLVQINRMLIESN